MVAPWLLGVRSGTAAGQAPDYRARLDSLFDILGTNQRVMGTVTIRQGERVLYQRSVGYRDSAAAGWGPPARPLPSRHGDLARCWWKPGDERLA